MQLWLHITFPFSVLGVGGCRTGLRNGFYHMLGEELTGLKFMMRPTRGCRPTPGDLAIARGVSTGGERNKMIPRIMYAWAQKHVPSLSLSLRPRNLYITLHWPAPNPITDMGFHSLVQLTCNPKSISLGPPFLFRWKPKFSRLLLIPLS
ncbi:hypothetical protein VTI74DRAFT_1734 [Chaetomium olivicolor]